jgi:hypothetical protein
MDILTYMQNNRQSALKSPGVSLMLKSLPGPSSNPSICLCMPTNIILDAAQRFPSLYIDAWPRWKQTKPPSYLCREQVAYRHISLQI